MEEKTSLFSKQYLGNTEQLHVELMKLEHSSYAKIIQRGLKTQI